MPPFWMARRVPFSTTEYPLVSDPIFTSLYCAPSCSCNETGAWALAVEKGNVETVRNTIAGMRRPNFSDIRTLPISSPGNHTINELRPSPHTQWIFQSRNRSRVMLDEREGSGWVPTLPSSRLVNSIPLQASVLQASPSRSLLFNLGLGLVGLLLLILQSLRRRIIRFRSRYIRSRGCGIRRLRNPARSLLFDQFAQATGELLLEMVVHFLQVVHFNGDSLPRRAVGFLTRRHAGSHCVVSVD